MTQPCAAGPLDRQAEVWSRSADAAVVDDGDAVYVLNLARLQADGIPRAFPGTAAAIWRRIDGRSTLAHLAVALAAEFGAVPEDLHEDLFGFVDELAAAGLLMRADPRAAPTR